MNTSKSFYTIDEYEALPADARPARVVIVPGIGVIDPAALIAKAVIQALDAALPTTTTEGNR
jgi:hypothetical protein